MVTNIEMDFSRGEEKKDDGPHCVQVGLSGGISFGKKNKQHLREIDDVHFVI